RRAIVGCSRFHIRVCIGVRLKRATRTGSAVIAALEPISVKRWVRLLPGAEPHLCANLAGNDAEAVVLGFVQPVAAEGCPKRPGGGCAGLGSAAAPSDSGQFRSVPRTCRLICGRLKVQKTAWPAGR